MGHHWDQLDVKVIVLDINFPVRYMPLHWDFYIVVNSFSAI
jgi:hypothetical protein